MKIHIDQNSNQDDDIEIVIRCREENEEVKNIKDFLNTYHTKIKGIKDNVLYLLDITQILYIDTVDKHTFLYTKEEVYESTLKLYQLEALLANFDFFRAGKSLIINFSQIKAIKPDFGGRLQVIMLNQEKLLISRQYAYTIKERLGEW